MRDLDELARLAKAATPGERFAVTYDGHHVLLRGSHQIVIGDDGVCHLTRADAEFYAAADPSTVLAMAEELRLARAVVEAARHASGLDHFCRRESGLCGSRACAALAAYDAHVRGGAK